jgi:hypothetical protein
LKFIFFFILFIIAMSSAGQDFQLVQSFPLARIAALQPSGENAISFAINDASLAGIKNFCFAIASEKRFMLQELQHFSAMAALPLKFGNAGLRIDRFGNAFMNELQCGLVFAKKLSSVLSVGIGFNYYSKNIPMYEKQTAIIAAAGMILHLSDQLVAGVHIYNPAKVQLGRSGERTPGRLSMGLGYSPSDKFFLAADLQKIEDQPVNIHAGVHYCIVQRVSVSTGITSAASSFYLGIGFQVNKFIITASAGMHPYLGLSPGLILGYNGDK